MTQTNKSTQIASKKKQVTALAAAFGVTVAALTTPFISQWESSGKPRLTAYQDIVGIWTLCDGETLGVKKGMSDTLEGCQIRLDKRLANDFAPAVAKCTPSLVNIPQAFAAAISLAYNIGVGAYCKSTVDRQFDAGNRVAACNAFLMWNKAGGKVITGLVRRREAERKLCMGAA